MQMLRESTHCVVFTGAGISTSSGIPDFRGPQGVWTREAMGLPPPPMKDFKTIKPTLTHMALAKLVEEKIVKGIVSQNVDGLHLRSGVPATALAEMHGNYSIERCPTCGEEYYRSAEAHSFKFDGKNRETGRVCLKCGDKLRDTIVNFNESLPRNALRFASAHTFAADLYLCLGSSLSVYPAASFPESHMNRGKRAVIVNLQRTHLDDEATLRIGAPVDVVMKLVMDELDIPIPETKDLDAELAEATMRKYREWGLD
ncbi:DHS-like NAD/FAD-binding domain-containing protein [Hyaloraphidium curvatum]|nr:DHS-like NAD/FAD-binding domain-containing protein [Hyaloraphidium curvatum]